jgi:hypothetical protein
VAENFARVDSPISSGDGLAAASPPSSEVFFSGDKEMAQLVHHSAGPDLSGPSHSLNHVASRIATWVWPPVEPESGTRQDGLDPATDDADPPAWSMRTMHWVPLVIPLAALGMLVMAVLIGSRL